MQDTNRPSFCHAKLKKSVAFRYFRKCCTYLENFPTLKNCKNKFYPLFLHIEVTWANWIPLKNACDTLRIVVY